MGLGVWLWVNSFSGSRVIRVLVPFALLLAKNLVSIVQM